MELFVEGAGLMGAQQKLLGHSKSKKQSDSFLWVKKTFAKYVFNKDKMDVCGFEVYYHMAYKIILFS